MFYFLNGGLYHCNLALFCATKLLNLLTYLQKYTQKLNHKTYMYAVCKHTHSIPGIKELTAKNGWCAC